MQMIAYDKDNASIASIYIYLQFSMKQAKEYELMCIRHVVCSQAIALDMGD